MHNPISNDMGNGVNFMDSKIWRKKHNSFKLHHTQISADSLYVLALQLSDKQKPLWQSGSQLHLISANFIQPGSHRCRRMLQGREHFTSTVPV